ncbi:hypothetical protein BC332_12609 [Capsicum chinense]|nr:hypothetical protein BC332_12609 [Capsicum chinense]
MDDCELADLVQKNLKGRRYLVVVDDIWSTDVWDSIRGIFPIYNNGSRILLTTRETELAMYANTSSPHEMNLLNLENGWKLLCDKVFGPKHDYPHELEEIGKEITEKCHGLPLTISVIAGYLSKMARTLQGWKIETGRLIQFWIAEGFVRTTGSHKSLEEVAINYLEDLISRNLIQARKRRFNAPTHNVRRFSFQSQFCSGDDFLVKAYLVDDFFCSGYHFDITLPGKIWMMKNLRYVHLAEATYSPSPRRESILNKHLVTPTEMPNLEGFFDLSYASCTNEVFSGTPNLKRLIIPVGFNCLPNRLIDMSSLTKLEAFKWYWNLRHCCRADDDAWRISDKDKFKSLKLLLLNNLNLKYLEASGDNFPNLKRLVLKNCYDLQETPFDFGEICTLESIEIHDCSTTAEDSARVIEQEQEDMGNNFLKENKGYSDGPSNASFQMLNL